MLDILTAVLKEPLQLRGWRYLLSAMLSQLPQLLPPWSFGGLFQAYDIIACPPQALVQEAHLGSFASPIYTLKHNEKSAAEAVAWESHTAEDREHMPRVQNT